MFEPYIDRLNFIRSILESPHTETVQEAYDLLYQLWTEYSENNKFIAEMKTLVKSYPTLAQEFTNRLNQSNCSDEERAKFSERINSLYQPKTQPKLPTNEKQEEKRVGVDKPSNHAKIKTIKLFLASSSELKDDRRGVEIWVRRENDKLIQKGFYLDLEIWEEFIDAMAETRSQDKYNNAVADSEVVVCLFGTKAGKYTEEEFDVAHTNFIEKGKPKYIFTYFKDVEIRTSDMNLDDLTSLQNFKDKLNGLGHFYTTYNSIEDLKRRLKIQLDEIIEEMS